MERAIIWKSLERLLKKQIHTVSKQTVNKRVNKLDMISHAQYNYRFDPSACEACGGKCCRGESGYIWAKYQEIVDMAAYLEMSIEDFATMYLRKVKHRYSLTEKKL